MFEQSGLQAVALWAGLHLATALVLALNVVRRRSARIPTRTPLPRCAPVAATLSMSPSFSGRGAALMEQHGGLQGPGQSLAGPAVSRLGHTAAWEPPPRCHRQPGHLTVMLLTAGLLLIELLPSRPLTHQ